MITFSRKMIDISISDDAQKFLRTLNDKHARQLIAKIELLARNPKSHRGKLLEGFAPLCRLRSGDYRIIYVVDGEVLKVPLIDRRNDDRIYRRLKKIFG